MSTRPARSVPRGAVELIRVLPIRAGQARSPAIEIEVGPDGWIDRARGAAAVGTAVVTVVAEIFLQRSYPPKKKSDSSPWARHDAPN